MPRGVRPGERSGGRGWRSGRSARDRRRGPGNGRRDLAVVCNDGTRLRDRRLRKGSMRASFLAASCGAAFTCVTCLPGPLLAAGPIVTATGRAGDPAGGRVGGVDPLARLASASACLSG
jgi:hypothetical protein